MMSILGVMGLIPVAVIIAYLIIKWARFVDIMESIRVNTDRIAHALETRVR